MKENSQEISSILDEIVYGISIVHVDKEGKHRIVKVNSKEGNYVLDLYDKTRNS